MKKKEPKFIIRAYDRGDRCWTDYKGDMTKEEADELYDKLTANGTKHTRLEDGYYYAIFPAGTRMVFDGESFT